ncbi:VOC family protein [Thalassomonas sp. M1454]|uniref:VOC family protein n=1 Tax=Thalassomonas sp. M1454 TaxID=2594477 RepID=UPI0011813D21|nr:VOC family protein [Thalassomonas sp. M1454]TRX55039.1 hypothetical protein FNN08_10585 [Thalassomonas sp. M1454]
MGNEQIHKQLKDHIIGLQHVGYIVPNLKQAVDNFKRVYGVTDDDIIIFPDYEISGPEVLTRFAFINVQGCEFELIEPISAEFKTLLNNSASGGAGINHVAWQVTDIEGAVAALATKNISPGHVTPNGVIDMGRKKMVYLDPQTTDGLLIELIEVIS